MPNCGGRRGSASAAVVAAFARRSAPGETKGTTVNPIGFTVPSLRALLERQGVKFDVPYREGEILGIAIAFFADPPGTYIELPEGLDELRDLARKSRPGDPRGKAIVSDPQEQSSTEATACHDVSLQQCQQPDTVAVAVRNALDTAISRLACASVRRTAESCPR